jgi:microcin C transport system substrate-binding protein
LLILPAVAKAADHALVLYGEPKYAADFSYFDYVNPKAPKGGEVKLASPFSYDSQSLQFERYRSSWYCDAV